MSCFLKTINSKLAISLHYILMNIPFNPFPFFLIKLLPHILFPLYYSFNLINSLHTPYFHSHLLPTSTAPTCVRCRWVHPILFFVFSSALTYNLTSSLAQLHSYIVPVQVISYLMVHFFRTTMVRGYGSFR